MDANATPTLHRYDLDGHEVRTVTNYINGIYDSAHPDQDITTDTVFDLNGKTVGGTDVLGHITTTQLDALGHATKVVRPDSTWTRTDYTLADRTSSVSRPGAPGAGDSTKPR